uniref:Immunoglobulin V-set domain-containing protein n=1 Tax=Cyclopterus lumpus TaxID=8103 RepID=A0A8C2Z2W4_CYCLU
MGSKLSDFSFICLHPTFPPYRVVSANGEAQVKCLVQPRPSHDLTPPYPHPDPEELRVTLLKGLYGAREACSSILTLTGQREPAVEHQGGVSVRCSAQMTEGAVEVTVTGLRAADTDLYRCDIEIFFPPPYLRLTGNGTLVHVLGGTARTETFLPLLCPSLLLLSLIKKKRKRELSPFSLSLCFSICRPDSGNEGGGRQSDRYLLLHFHVDTLHETPTE